MNGMQKFFLTGALVILSGAYFLFGNGGGSLADTATGPLATAVATSPATAATSTEGAAIAQPLPGQYADGSYTGPVVDAYYGLVQVRATVAGGKLTGITFLQYPNDRDTSLEISHAAIPYLTQEAIAAQSAKVDIISGATDTSIAFQKSLGSALIEAQS